MHQHHEWQKILIVKKKLWNLINNGGHDLLIFLNFPWLFICKFIKGKTSWKLENIKNSYKSEPNCSKNKIFVQKIILAFFFQFLSQNWNVWNPKHLVLKKSNCGIFEPKIKISQNQSFWQQNERLEYLVCNVAF